MSVNPVEWNTEPQSPIVGVSLGSVASLRGGVTRPTRKRF